MNKSLNSNHKTPEPSPIQLRDTGITYRIVKTFHTQQAKVRATDQGIEISVPSVSDVQEKLQEIFWGALLVVIGFGCASVLIVEGIRKGGVELLKGLGQGIVSGLLGTVGCPFLIQAVNKQTICMSHDTMTIRKGILRRKQTYTLQDVWNVRCDDLEYRFGIDITFRDKASQRCNLLFDYGTGKYQQGYVIPQTIRCCHRISREEAERLVTLLSDILTFHCHSVERIIFGVCQVPEPGSSMTLQNPDVSTLTTPFFHLKHVDVYAETYDFHQVERFLTYAVNYIGQEYLKKHVEVHIYGDTEKLEPNLYNNFQNLCKGVHLKEHFSYE